MNFNYITIDLIIERLNQIKLPGQSFNISEIKEWTYQALTKIGAVKEFINTTLEVEIIDNKGLLPHNIHTMESVLEGSSGYNMESIASSTPFRELTYKVNAGYIYTNFDTGSVLLQCSIFPVDDDGRPLIPDNEYFISAVYSYIRMKLGERAMWQNKIAPGQFTWLEREWNFYCPAAKNDSKMLREDGMYNLMRTRLKSMPNFYRNPVARTTSSVVINASKPF